MMEQCISSTADITKATAPHTNMAIRCTLLKIIVTCIKQLTRQTMYYNVTLRRVLATIVAAEKE
jgi:hypothetical protein